MNEPAEQELKGGIGAFEVCEDDNQRRKVLRAVDKNKGAI